MHKLLVAGPLVATALAGSLATALPANAAPTDPALVGQVWQLSSARVSASAAARSTLAIAADGTVTVTTACNLFTATGRATVGTDGTIAFPSFASTQKSCTADAGTAESMMADAVRSTSRTVVNNLLVLRAPDGTLTFLTRRAAPSTPATGVQGTTWRLDDPSLPSTVTSRATFTIAADGTLTATSPCNELIPQGTATVTATSITFPPVGSTMMGCSGDVARAEDELVRALSGTVSYRLDGARLVLTTADRTVVTFRR